MYNFIYIQYIHLQFVISCLRQNTFWGVYFCSTKPCHGQSEKNCAALLSYVKLSLLDQLSLVDSTSITFKKHSLLHVAPLAQRLQERRNCCG